MLREKVMNNANVLSELDNARQTISHLELNLANKTKIEEES